MLLYFIVPSPFFQKNVIHLLLEFILLPKWFFALAPSETKSAGCKGDRSQLALLLGGLLF